MTVAVVVVLDDVVVVDVEVVTVVAVVVVVLVDVVSVVTVVIVDVVVVMVDEVVDWVDVDVVWDVTVVLVSVAVVVVVDKKHLPTTRMNTAASRPALPPMLLNVAHTWDILLYSNPSHARPSSKHIAAHSLASSTPSTKIKSFPSETVG